MLKKLSANKVFCIGIGGIGVSGLAELLHLQGVSVSGADVIRNAQTERLQSLGLTIYDSHQSDHVKDVDLVVYSSAVSKRNPERMAAEKAHIPLVSRGQLLADLMQSDCNIAVAGTHGKTTTAGLIAWMLENTDQDPTFVIGGIMRDRQSPVKLGGSRFFVAESDESDASFLLLSPTIAVLTNIDADHMETYDHNFDQLKKSFLKFVSHIPDNGCVIACCDDPVIRELIPQIKARVITYGESSTADCQLLHFHQSGLQSDLTVKMPNQQEITLRLNLAGKHNALNALSALVIAHEYSLSFDAVNHAMATFPGMGRRFHPHGEIAVPGGKALLFDDYGHHPTELKVTLAAAKSAWPDRRVIMVFQPHRYSRTRDLMQDFVDVLKTADQLILTEIYAASEEKIDGADGQSLYNAVKNAGADHAEFIAQITDLPAMLSRIAKPNDVIILQGAGNIVTMAKVLMGVK